VNAPQPPVLCFSAGGSLNALPNATRTLRRTNGGPRRLRPSGQQHAASQDHASAMPDRVQLRKSPPMWDLSHTSEDAARQLRNDDGFILRTRMPCRHRHSVPGPVERGGKVEPGPGGLPRGAAMLSPGGERLRRSLRAPGAGRSDLPALACLPSRAKDEMRSAGRTVTLWPDRCTTMLAGDTCRPVWASRPIPCIRSTSEAKAPHPGQGSSATGRRPRWR
jgi:hypothetical protein